MTEIFGHRGYAAVFSENTMTAFIEAAKIGAEGLELDVQLTKDGVPVIIHDEKVERTTGSTGLVKDYTYKQLRTLNADFKQMSKMKSESIPSLEEVLEWLASTNMICNIELKNGIVPYKGMEEKVIEQVRTFGLEDRTIISSFNHYSVVYSYRIAPEIETAPLFSELLYMPWVYTQAIGAAGFHPKYHYATDEIIANAHQNGIAVRPYTVNKEKDMERLFLAASDAIITDDPAFALKVRQQIQKKKRP